MKAINTVLVILLALAVVFYFTKPTDEICIEKAKSNIEGAQYSNSVPGYDNPTVDNYKGPIGREAIFVKDKILWKEVDYIVRGQIKVIAYAWLGRVRLVKDAKNKDS
jgi:hypothetical protein